ncbi:hypothetical protein Dimus_018571 [Dionaea muscipula]
MIVIHLKKKDIVKSKVRGIEIEFDHEKLATIQKLEALENYRGDSTRCYTRFNSAKDKGIAGVDPSGPTSREADFLKFQAEFERKRANRFHDELEKAKAENAKLLALLHKTQTKPHP